MRDPVLADGIRRGLSWREFVVGAAGSLAALGGVVPKAVGQETTAARFPVPASGADLALLNGRFVDYRGTVGSALTIRNGRIQDVGSETAPGPDTPVIDLEGRTVIPGFVDSHVHYTRAGVNPGYQERRIERAFSIAELQETIARRAASVPASEFITCVGGWNHNQFAEARRPTKTELDDAAPDHAVYLSGTRGGTGAITNSRGQAFFAANGVEVDGATGVVSSAPTALAALQAVQTPDDKLRGTLNINAFASSVGLTTVVNSGNLADQEYPLRLWREDRLHVRMRPMFPAGSPEEVEPRVLNNFSQGGRAVGDDLFRPAGFGERIGGMNTMSAQFEPIARMIARHGWLPHQHSITTEENSFHIAAFRSIARDYSIDPLRWALIHLREITRKHLDALIDLGAGASGQTWMYLSPAGGGPPFRRIIDSGIPAGVGTDSTNVSALDPWLGLFYLTIGRNLAGDLTNDGQQISRLEALGLYTQAAAWFSFDDHQVGSFEQGKYADLAVLSADYLTVPDEMIRKIDSVLTLVGGRVAHASGPFAPPG